MDLRRELIALVAPLDIGDTIEPGVSLISVSAELGLRLVLGYRDREVAIEVDAATEARRHAARSRHFTFSYRVGDREAPLDADTGRLLCELVASLAAKNEDEVLARLRRQAEAIGSEGATRIRETRALTLLERAGSADEPYWTLSPYVGCLIGCRFCYAPSRLDPLRRLCGLPPAPWGSWVDVRVDAAEVLARELRTHEPWPIKLCPIVSDPYQAVEKRYRATRRCLETLREAPRRDVLVLTRASMITEDAELLASIPGAWAGVSLPTIDDEVRAHFEPRGAPIADRLRALEVLRDAGVRTFAIVQPMFPGSIEGLADALAERVTSVRLDVLHGTYGAARDFAHERYTQIASSAWQTDRLTALGEALARRGVRLWTRELPSA